MKGRHAKGQDPFSEASLGDLVKHCLPSHQGFLKALVGHFFHGGSSKAPIA